MIPPEKLKFKSITCSDACARDRKLALRARQDQRECRFCRKPTTPAEKAAYQRFRKWEIANPALAYPAQFKQWAENNAKLGAEDVDVKLFTLEIAQRMAQEEEDAAERAEADAARGIVASPLAMEPICTPGTSL
jgi:hypothetical protein